MRTTLGLFQNVQRLDLVWNNIILLTQDSLTANVVRSFNLTIIFNPTDVIRVDGRVNLALKKNPDNEKWQISRWLDESNFLRKRKMGFVLKETIKLILRSKLNFFLNLISLTLCVLLILLSFYLIRASKFLQEYVQQNISLNIFIKDSVSDDLLNNFSEQLKNQPFTSKIEFISKEKAAEIFLKETGEDFRKILDYNPLPASYTLYLKNEYTNKDSLKKVINTIQQEAIVTEVVSKMEFLQKIIAFSEKVKLYIFMFTGFMLLVSIYLVYSTVKLIMIPNMKSLKL